MQTELQFNNFDFAKEFLNLKAKRSALDFEAIERLLIVQKSKILMMKKRGLSNDIEKVVEWAAKEDQKLKEDFLKNCSENGFTENDLISEIEKARK